MVHLGSRDTHRAASHLPRPSMMESIYHTLLCVRERYQPRAAWFLLIIVNIVLRCCLAEMTNELILCTQDNANLRWDGAGGIKLCRLLQLASQKLIIWFELIFVLLYYKSNDLASIVYALDNI